MSEFLEKRKEEGIRELNILLDKKDYVKLKEELGKFNPVDITDYFEVLSLYDAVVVFRLLNKDAAAAVFARLSKDQQVTLIKAFTDDELKSIVDDLFFDDKIDIIGEMPASVVKKIIGNSNENQRKLINQFLNFPENSAGSLMTIEYVELKEYMTVEEALQLIKDTGINKQTVYTCYVTGPHKKLKGFVSLRTIVTSDSNVKIEDLLEQEVIYVHTHDDQEHVAEVFRRYGFVVLPVVDNEDRMTGIITVDDIMDVMEQEATEDFQKMAAMAPDDEEYLDSNVFDLAKHRIAWLLILMISATFTGNIMKAYADVIQTVIVLNMFVPMIMDAGGNAGSQSSTLIIRGLATGEIKLTDWSKVLFKEFRVSLLVGIILGSVNFMKCMFLDKVGLPVSLLVSFTLMCTITLAKVIGGMLPILAKKAKLDPAIMAGPLITTIVDAISLMIYFNIAKLFIGL